MIRTNNITVDGLLYNVKYFNDSVEQEAIILDVNPKKQGCISDDLLEQLELKIDENNKVRRQPILYIS